MNSPYIHLNNKLLKIIFFPNGNTRQPDHDLGCIFDFPEVKS